MTPAPLPDLVGRLFDPDRLDDTWVGDVTYVSTDEGWLYLATVLDLGSRRLIGYSMSDVADTDHVINAVAMAVAARGRVTMADYYRWPQFFTPTAARRTRRPTTARLWDCASRRARLHSACGYRPPVEYEQISTINQRPVGSHLPA